MSKKRRHPKASERKEQIARVTKRRLLLVIGSLVAVLTILIFKVGGSLWPDWLMDYRRLFIAILGFVVIFLTLFSPIIIEFNSDPGQKSGPGDLPSGYGGGTGS
jgi:hypothetical protein